MTFRRILLCLFILNLVGSTCAFAQSYSDHKMKSIQKSLERAEIIIPNEVMRQLEALQIQSRKLDQFERAQSIKNILKDQKFETAEDLLRLQKREKDYYTSVTYRAFAKELDTISQKSLDLVAPYIGAPPAAPPKLSHLSYAEYLAYIIGHYRDDYGVPEAELQQIEKILKEKAIANEKFRTLIQERESPEYIQLRSKMTELDREKRQILKPYSQKLKTKRRAKENIRRVLRPQNIRRDLTNDEKADKDLERIEKRYSEHGIQFLDWDRKAMKVLLSEFETLKEKVYYARLKRSGDAPTLEEVQLQTHHDSLETRMKALIEPYDEQLRAAQGKK